MDVSPVVVVVLLGVWGTLLACVALGAVIYHWPGDIRAEHRRGFDVLPPRDWAG